MDPRAMAPADAIRVLYAAESLAKACGVLRHNPCKCPSCTREKERLILAALGEFDAAMRLGERQTAAGVARAFGVSPERARLMISRSDG